MAVERALVAEWIELWHRTGERIDSGWPENGRRPAGAFGTVEEARAYAKHMHWNPGVVTVVRVRRFKVKR